MIFNNDSIEVIEENLTTSRTATICQHITTISDKIWGASFRKCAINDADFEKLTRMLKKCKHLKYLNLNINLINSSTKLGNLTLLVGNLAYLDTLCLHSNDIGDEGLGVIFYSLKNLSLLKSLDIGDCNLSDQSVDYIKDLIAPPDQKKGLCEIILSSNPKITISGWSKILLAVSASSNLKFFHIDFNCLDDNCGFLIASILCSNSLMEILDLEQTGIGNKTAELLIYVIKNYKLNLKTLNLLNNPIDYELEAEIKKYIKCEYDDDSLNQLNKMEKNFTRQSLDLISKRNTNNNKNLTKKFKDQFKFDKVFEKANRLKSNSYNKIQHKANDMSNLKSESKLDEIENDIYDDDQHEFLKTYEDLRFKTHSILPFNINKF